MSAEQTPEEHAADLLDAIPSLDNPLILPGNVADLRLGIEFGSTGPLTEISAGILTAHNDLVQRGYDAEHVAFKGVEVESDGIKLVFSASKTLTTDFPTPEQVASYTEPCDGTCGDDSPHDAHFTEAGRQRYTGAGTPDQVDREGTGDFE